MTIPPEHAAFAALVDTQPAPATEGEGQAFHSRHCLAIADRGALRMVEA